MARPALALLRGSGDRTEVTLGMAAASVAYWERAVDRCTDEVVACASHERLRRHCASARLFAACDQLQAALNRRDRLVCEAQGIRWLWRAGENADG